MRWNDSRTAFLARGLGAEDRRILQASIEQADLAAGLRDKRALDHGYWVNVRPDPIDFRDRVYQPGLIALASSQDPPPELGEIPVRDQGYLTSCTGMALATAVDVLRRRQWALAGKQGEAPPPASARMLYEMGRAFDEHPDDGLRGSSVRGVLRGFFHNGVCREDSALDDPLQVGPNDWEFTIDRAKDARRVMLGLYARMQHTLLDYHCALNEVGVVIVSTKLHDGWKLGANLDSETTKERWRIRWDRSQRTCGGHAVLIVGYDEDGFLIRNSWGDQWSCWRDVYAGVAHWSYDDWQHNVMDGWVIRLGVTASHDARTVGGSFTTPGALTAPLRSSPPRILVNGHYLHLKDGRLVAGGTYNCSQRSIAATAALLEMTQDYDHLLLAVESGLESFDTMVERAVVLVPYLKSARIYPLFIWWRESCFELASELLEDRARRLEPRTGGVQQLGTFMLEAFAREFMQPFWRTFEGEAERSFTLTDSRRGEAWTAIRTLLGAARKRTPPLHVHAVAHSVGAVWLGRLCHRLVDEATTSADWPGPAALGGLFQTISLLAPICPPNHFTDAKVSRLWEGDGQPRLAVYTLRDEDEENDRVGAYQGSLLHLAQRAFPVNGVVPDGIDGANRILGRAGVARGLGQRSDTRWFPVNGRAIGSTCRTHRELATDLDVYQHILDRILGVTAKPLPIARLP